MVFYENTFPAKEQPATTLPSQINANKDVHFAVPVSSSIFSIPCHNNFDVSSINPTIERVESPSLHPPSSPTHELAPDATDCIPPSVVQTKGISTIVHTQSVDSPIAPTLPIFEAPAHAQSVPTSTSLAPHTMTPGSK